MPAQGSFNLNRLGWGLTASVVFLASVGLLAIHASDQNAPPGLRVEIDTLAPAASNWFQSMFARIGPGTLRQLLYFLSGLILLRIVIGLGYRRIGDYAYLIYWVNLALLVLLLVDRYGSAYGLDVPLIPERRATWRWIELGPVSLQPSEFMKVALILALARYLRFRDSYRTWAGLIPPFLMTVLPMALILKQPDLGTVLMLLPVLFAIIFVAGARIRHLALIVCVGLALLPAFYFFGMEKYQQQRIQVLLRQGDADESWHMGPGYQLRQGLIALGTGRVTGAGWGEGAFVEHALLPEENNDFIFAFLGNQGGLVGGLLVILAYVVIVVLGIEVATATNEPFGRLLAVGVVVMIVAQALLNICMNLGLAPITGMTLPFVSAGGSSLWANFIGLGLLVSVAQKRPLLVAPPPFEHRE